MTSPDPKRARVFGSMAASYDRWRPSYPPEAVEWLTPPGAERIADVGAGTGKLTGLLLARGIQVVAIEPDPDMLEVLARNHPTAECVLAGAEALPIPDASVDAVLVGQAWHWFDQQRALDEARRVVRPGGRLGLVWNADHPRAAWQLELEGLNPDRTDRNADDESEPWVPPGLAGLPLETLEVPWQEQLSAVALRSRLATHSVYAVMSTAERTRRLDEAAALLQREAHRIGSTAVPFDQTAYCARVLL